jgi:hypothetical protein
MNNNHKCESCDYETTTLCNYKKHLLTKKHKINLKLEKVKDLYKEDFNIKKEDFNIKKEDFNNKKEDSKNNNDKMYNKRQSKINCIYCFKMIFSTNISRHYKICKIKNNTTIDKKELSRSRNSIEQYDPLEKIQDLTTKLQSKEEEINKLKLEKELDMIKTKYELAIEQNEKYEDIIKNQSSKVTYNINYIMNNCKDAYNYDELMNEPLTIEEINDLNDSSALVGSTLDP